MKSILMISIELPYPPNSGGRMKSWNMLNYLQKNFELGLACPLKYGSNLVDAFKSKIKLKHFVSDAIEAPRNVKTLLKSYLQGVPINVLRSQSNKLKDDIKDIAHHYDALLIDHYEATQYIPKDYKGEVILHTHNATYLMWKRYSSSGFNIPFRMVTAIETLRVKKYELMATKRANLVFASPNDIDSLVKIGSDRKKFRETYHLGDDSQLKLPSLEFNNTSKSLLYIGTLNWEANIDGLLWFFDKVWPSIKLKHPDLIFTIVGGNIDPRLLKAAEHLKGIDFTGYADDLEDYFSTSRLFLAPLRFGAGIKVKVLNAMCRGIPTVTTSIGSEGLQTQHMKHLCIADSPAEMVDSIDVLLTNQEKWEILEKESRSLIKKHYTWEKVLGYMVSEINNSLDKAPYLNNTKNDKELTHTEFGIKNLNTAR